MFWDVFSDLCSANNVKPNVVTKRLGLSSATATNWKTSGRTPNGDTLLAVADYFGCSVDYLLGRTTDIQSHLGAESPSDEAALIDTYRSCDDYGKRAVIETAQRESNRTQAQNTNAVK